MLFIPVFINTNGPFYLIPDAKGPIYLNVHPAAPLLVAKPEYTKTNKH
jgi:hypothetical protein